MPIRITISIAALESSTVAGSRSSARPIAGTWWRSESPRSPCAAEATNEPNCTISGRSKPSAWRNAAISAAEDSGGIITAAGSPLRCRIRNTTIATPTSAHSAPSARRTRNASTQLSDIS